ncbi:thymidylate synthase [Clostridium phage phiCP13O]|uniref:thymidylate synthase n=1 Tax=Clostridium phage phiCP13O TaxID=1042122 RepID=UPI000214C740|nr:thymidylate synthase [Clostridium phage phiCP13O]AEI74475.1 predicted alternative thymidylate synthase [Clostridium phage phiCP13O]
MKVSLIDITNNPIEKIYKAYRICYSKDSWDNIKIKSEKEMCDFIVPLMMEQHTSPLEHVSFSFAIEGISRACLAQLTRHRTFKFNVQSQRYINAENFSVVMPDLSYIGDKEKEQMTREYMWSMYEEIFDLYKVMVRNGVKKEDARAILPQATTCNLIVTMDLNNFRNFLRQRKCIHAQKEIRELAFTMIDLLKPHIPFVDYKVLLCEQGLCSKCLDKINQ